MRLPMERQNFAQQVEIAVGGAPPPSPVIAAMEEMGFRVTHLYGLTECYGPSLISEWQDDWTSSYRGSARRKRWHARAFRHWPSPKRLL